MADTILLSGNILEKIFTALPAEDIDKWLLTEKRHQIISARLTSSLSKYLSSPWYDVAAEMSNSSWLEVGNFFVLEVGSSLNTEVSSPETKISLIESSGFLESFFAIRGLRLVSSS